jgi:23S rRNA pseudouridine1911/1915/1917 synthase
VKQPRGRDGRTGNGSMGNARPGSHVEFLYEDEDIVAVDKPCGLPTISPEGSRSKSLYDIVTAHIQRRNPKGRAAVVHRLDRDTSGVIVFAKSARAKTVLMSTWNESVDERLYVALVEGTLTASLHGSSTTATREPEAGTGEGMLDSWLSDADPFRVRQVPPGTRGALRAVTRYRVLAKGDGFSLLELSLETGRRHQIRAQLAAVGCPVAGDERYGSRRDPLGRLGLHAAVISLKRPSDGATIRVECPAPPGFAAALRGTPASNKRMSGTAAPAGSPSGHAPRTARAKDSSGSKPPRGTGAFRTAGEPAKPRAARPHPSQPELPSRPADRSRAWPGGGPSSRGGKAGPGKETGRREPRRRG